MKKACRLQERVILISVRTVVEVLAAGALERRARVGVDNASDFEL